MNSERLSGVNIPALHMRFIVCPGQMYQYRAPVSHTLMVCGASVYQKTLFRPSLRQLTRLLYWSSLFSFFLKFPLTCTNYENDNLCFEYEIMLLMSMIMVVRTNYCSDKDDIGIFWWYDWCCYCCCMVETSRWQKDSEMVGLLPRWHQPSTSSNIVYLNLAFEFNN